LKQVSVIIPWRGRPELAMTLRKNSEKLAAAGAEILVVSGGGDINLVRKLIEDSGRQGVSLLDLEGMEPFNKSACLNVGAIYATGEILFTLDADVVLNTSFLEDAIEAVKSGPCFVSAAERLESDPSKQGERWNPESKVTEQSSIYRLAAENGRSATYEYSDRREGIRTGPGDIVIRRKDYLEIGGFNSQLVGWGFEDYDFQIRVQLGLGLERRTFGQVLHVSHEYGGGRTTLGANKSVAFKNYAEGNYLGSFEQDAATWNAVAPENV